MSKSLTPSTARTALTLTLGGAQRERGYKCRALKLLLFLFTLCVGGAIINVAVAWGCALFVVVPASPDLESGPYRSWMGSLDWAKDDWRVLVWRQTGWVRVFSLIPDEPSVPTPSDSYVIEMMDWSAFLLDENGDQIPVWSRASQNARGERSSVALVEDGFGWPTATLKSQLEADTAGKIIHSNSLQGIPIRELRAGRVTWPDDFDVPRALPLTLIFPGFAINTIFYAAVLYAVFAVPGAVRRRIVVGRASSAASVHWGGAGIRCVRTGVRSVLNAAALLPLSCGEGFGDRF